MLTATSFVYSVDLLATCDTELHAMASNKVEKLVISGVTKSKTLVYGKLMNDCFTVGQGYLTWLEFGLIKWEKFFRTSVTNEEILAVNYVQFK